MAGSGWAELCAWQVDRESDTPLVRQIYGQIRQVIMSRTLKAGTKLPSSRALAAKLGVARASVVTAYEQLLAESVISGKTGSGTYISFDLPPPLVGAARPSSARAAHAPALIEESSEGDERPFTGGRTLLDARTIEVWRKLLQRAFRPFAAPTIWVTAIRKASWVCGRRSRTTCGPRAVCSASPRKSSSPPAPSTPSTLPFAR